MIQKKVFIAVLIFWGNVFTIFSQTLEMQWQTEAVFRDPESIVFDSKRNCFYVSNMDKSTPVQDLRSDPISLISFDGQKVEVEWMSGFSTPTGMLLSNDTLYVVERDGVAWVDVSQKKVLKRTSVVNQGYLNDITMDDKGHLYVSDSEKGIIYRIKDGKSEAWHTSKSGGGINGLFYDRGKIFFGDNGDHTFKSICLKSQKVKNISYLGEGNIDGIQKLSAKRYLVSHFMGNLYVISTKGKVDEIFQSRGKNLFVADFAYLPQHHLIVIPSLRTHHIYSLKYEP